MRAVRFVVLSLGLAVAAHGSVSAAPPSRRTLDLGPSIAGVAADGPRAATVVTGDWTSGGVADTGLVWTLASDSVKRSKPTRGPGPWCGRESVALAGPLVAWMHVCESNNEFRQALVVWAPPRTPRVVAAVDVVRRPAARLSKPIADGSLLVYNQGSTLFKVLRDGRVRPIANGVEATDVDRGRISGWLDDGTVGILSTHGRIVRSLDIERGQAEGVQLDGRFLLVIRRSKVEVRSAVTGELLRTFPIDGGWENNVAAAGGIAAVGAGGRLDAIRLVDNRRVVLSRVGERLLADIAVESTGIYFAQRADAQCPPRCARLTFVPRSEIDARLRGPRP